MYEVTGIITFWVLRIGLIVLLVLLVIDFHRFRQTITRSVKVSENTWQRRPLTVTEAARHVPWYGWLTFILVLVLTILCWLTLLIF